MGIRLKAAALELLEILLQLKGKAFNAPCLLFESTTI